MTVTWTDWEFETRAAPRYQWARPPRIGGRGLVKIGANGLAEIKPHTRSGIEDGLAQLKGRRDAGPRVLVTYQALDAADRPIDSGVAHRVRVFATHFTDTTPAVLLNRPAWTDLGVFPAPRSVPLRVDNPGLFGSVIERWVRDHFTRTVLVPSSRTVHRGTGGAAPGPDITWKELAEFYAELASELAELPGEVPA